jgi:hypothetical protein
MHFSSNYFNRWYEEGLRFSSTGAFYEVLVALCGVLVASCGVLGFFIHESGVFIHESVDKK